MEKTLQKFGSFRELKDAEYRYWQTKTPEERLAAAFAMSIEGYREQGYPIDGFQLKRVAVRSKRTSR